MLGARRKVNSPIADACRLSICVSTLVLDTKDRFIDDLSIDEGDVECSNSVGVTSFVQARRQVAPALKRIRMHRQTNNVLPPVASRG